MMSKTCSMCKTDKPINAFFGYTEAHPELAYGICKECQAHLAQQWSSSNKSEPPAKKVCTRCHKEKPIDQFGNYNRLKTGKHIYCLDCADEMHKEWIRENPEIYTKSSRKSALKNWYRRQAELKANGGSHTDDEWQELCARYGNRCVCCGRKTALQHDHIIPVSLGGPSDIGNIQPLCKRCNDRKGTRIIDYRPDQKPHDKKRHIGAGG